MTITLTSTKPVMIMGLGKSGIAAVRAFRATNSPVYAWDNNIYQRQAAEALGASCVDPAVGDLAGCAALVLAPGIPLTHPHPHAAVIAAQKAGIPIIGDIDLYHNAAGSGFYIGVTGTNGKSTTTSLIGHVLSQTQSAQKTPPLIGGNLGFPVLDFPKAVAGQPVVLELSSYQLDLTVDFTCSVAVLTNITPDHLDRHGDMAGYAAAKSKIFRRDSHKPQTAIIGIDTPETAAIADRLDAEGHWHLIRISGQSVVDGGVYVVGGILYDATEGQAQPVMQMADAMALPGWHNGQNAAAAYAACRASGCTPEEIIAGFKNFAGIPHRQQRVATHEQVVFINDSKATNADAAAMALACYPRIYWIAGGRPKAGGLDGLESYMDRIVHAYLIGEAEDEFARWLAGRAAADICGTLEFAVHAATKAALKDSQPSVVLLSPACASFDQFAHFEERGDKFIDYVMTELNALGPRKQAG